MKRTSPPDVSELRARLTYSPKTGRLSWRRRAGLRMQGGRSVGTSTTEGREVVTFDGRQLCTRKVAWAMAHGEWPSGRVVALNGDPADIRLSNLAHQPCKQPGTPRQPKSSRFPGVTWRKDKAKWQANGRVCGRVCHFGYFKYEEDAHAAFVAGKAQLEAEAGNA